MSRLFCYLEAARPTCLSCYRRPLALLLKTSGACGACVLVCAHAPRSNMTYSFGLGEKAKQRVDEAGHIELTDAEARKLLRTKVFCTTAAVVGIGAQHRNPASIRKLAGEVNPSGKLSHTWNIRKPGRNPT